MEEHQQPDESLQEAASESMEDTVKEGMATTTITTALHVVGSLYTAITQGIYQDPLILPVASACLSAQIVLTLLFSSRLVTQGPWKTTAVFSAKQVIVVAMMLLQTYVGCTFWFKKSSTDGNTILGQGDDTAQNEGGVLMARLVLGGLLQDVPTGFMTGAVDTMMHLHHAGMFLVATICLGYWSNGVPIMATYAPFFFGVIELSSVPLTLVDLFHPQKQSAWHQYHLEKPFLQKLNEGSRYLFAFLYIVLRMIYFPFVTFGQVIPDGMAKLNVTQNQPYRVPVMFIMVFSVLFTALQMYWGMLILKQVQKTFFKGGNKGDGAASGKTKPKIKAV